MIKQRSGFTLVELMVVIVIIVLLATLVAVSYRSVVKRSHDQSRQAVATEVKSGLSQRRNITHNVVPDANVTSKSDFVKQYQLGDVTGDLVIKFVRNVCVSAISDSCGNEGLSKEKISFYVNEQTQGDGEASAAYAAIAYWAERGNKYIVHKVSYDRSGNATVQDIELADGSRWSNL